MTNNIERSVLASITLTALLLQTSRARAVNDIKTGEAVYVNEVKNDIRNALKKAGIAAKLNFEATLNNNNLRRWTDNSTDLNSIVISVTSKHAPEEMALIEAYISRVLTAKTYYRQGYATHSTKHHTLFLVNELTRKDGLLKRAPFYVESLEGQDMHTTRKLAQGKGYIIRENALYPVYKAYVVFES